MKDYERITSGYFDCSRCKNGICEMLDSLCGSRLYCETYNRLAELEDKIESGELVDRNAYLDYLMAAKDTSELTDKEIEFFAKHNARVREYVNAEIARLTAENASLQKRLGKAVELPCIEPMTTWDWDDTTGLGKSNFGKYWKVLYRDEDGEFMAYMGATKAEAEAVLEELKRG